MVGDRSLDAHRTSFIAAAQEADRRAAYGSDITYATNSELGFDFLRDNLATVRFASSCSVGV